MRNMVLFLCEVMFLLSLVLTAYFLHEKCERIERAVDSLDRRILMLESDNRKVF